VEKKEKRKKLEYLKKLCNEILSEEATLKEDTEILQIVRTKYKKVVNISSEEKASL